MSGDLLDGATPTLPGLPIELILTILEHALQAASGKPYANFQKFSLICRVFMVLSSLPIEFPFHLLGLQSWRPVAQHLLFRAVRLYAAERVPQFLYATAPDSLVPSTRRLGHWVHSLEYHTGTPESKALFPYVLRHCPNLHELKLTIMGTLDVRLMVSPPPSKISLPGVPAPISYADIPLPCPVVYQMSTANPSFGGPSITVRPFLYMWRGIRHLVVHATALGYIPYSIQAQINPDWDIPEELKLYELQIFTADWDQYQGRVLHKILQHSVGTLRILDLVCSDLPPNVSDLLALHGPHLRSLRLPQLRQNEVLPDIVKCIALEEIVFRSYPPKAIREAMLLNTLVHVSFITLSSQASYTVRPMIRILREMPKLEVVTWVYRGKDRQRTEPNLQQLHDLGAERKIRIRTHTASTPSVRIFRSKVRCYAYEMKNDLTECTLSSSRSIKSL